MQNVVKAVRHVLAHAVWIGGWRTDCIQLRHGQNSTHRSAGSAGGLARTRAPCVSLGRRRRLKTGPPLRRPVNRTRCPPGRSVLRSASGSGSVQWEPEVGAGKPPCSTLVPLTGSNSKKGGVFPLNWHTILLKKLNLSRVSRSCGQAGGKIQHTHTHHTHTPHTHTHTRLDVGSFGSLESPIYHCHLVLSGCISPLRLTEHTHTHTQTHTHTHTHTRVMYLGSLESAIHRRPTDGSDSLCLSPAPYRAHTRTHTHTHTRTHTHAHTHAHTDIHV